MYGAELIRRRLHLARGTVASELGIAPATLKLLEEEVPGSMTVYFYMTLADYYGVTIDELTEEYPDDAIGMGGHPPTMSSRERESNCLTWYRRQNNLTFDELAVLLNKNHRFLANNACAKPIACEEDVERLAALEGITPDEFRVRYSAANAQTSEDHFPTINMIETGSKIRQYRLARGVFASQLQARFGFGSPKMISNWEMGKCLPSVEELYALSRFLKVNMDNIVVGVADNEP